ncbi:uncharacterized protein [Antedon mediterranea]|uniref:uncharacterized protein n=1 Tax=Antedon mediterranea TaxID=105859 RepID=UPI003AF44FC9
MALDSEFINRLKYDSISKEQRFKATKRGIDSYRQLERLAERQWRSCLGVSGADGKTKPGTLKTQDDKTNQIDLNLGERKEIDPLKCTVNQSDVEEEFQNNCLPQMVTKIIDQNEERDNGNDTCISRNLAQNTSMETALNAPSKELGIRHYRLKPLKISRTRQLSTFGRNTCNGHDSDTQSSGVTTFRRTRRLATSNFSNNNGTVEYSQQLKLRQLQKQQNEYKRMMHSAEVDDDITTSSTTFLRQKTALLLRKVDTLLKDPHSKIKTPIFEYQGTSVKEVRTSSLSEDDISTTRGGGLIVKAKPRSQNCTTKSTHTDGHNDQDIRLVLKSLSVQRIDIHDKCRTWLEVNPVN